MMFQLLLALRKMIIQVGPNIARYLQLRDKMRKFHSSQKGEGRITFFLSKHLLFLNFVLYFILLCGTSYNVISIALGLTTPNLYPFIMHRNKFFEPKVSNFTGKRSSKSLYFSLPAFHDEQCTLIVVVHLIDGNRYKVIPLKWSSLA